MFSLCSGLTVEQLSKASDLACWNDYACHHGERHGLTEAPISYRLGVMVPVAKLSLTFSRSTNLGLTGLVVIASSVVRSRKAQNEPCLVARPPRAVCKCTTLRDSGRYARLARGP